MIPTTATTRDIERALDNVYFNAKVFKLTSLEIHTATAKIFDRLNSRFPSGKRRFPEFLSAYAHGYNAGKRNVIWDLMEFCYRDSDGVIYSTLPESKHHKTEELYAAGRAEEVSKMEGAHLWKGTDKIFTPWSR